MPSAPKLTRNPNAGKHSHAERLPQRPTVRWTKPKRTYRPGMTKAARIAGTERQHERFIEAAVAWYGYQNG